MNNKIIFAILFSFFCNIIYCGDNNDNTFQCFGTEPFWSADVTADSVIFKLMGEVTYIFNYSGTTKAEGLKEEFIKIFRLENDSIKSAFLIIKKTEKCKCSDGMSDNEYDYEAYFLINNKAYFGCAVRK